MIPSRFAPVCLRIENYLPSDSYTNTVTFRQIVLCRFADTFTVKNNRTVLANTAKPSFVVFFMLATALSLLKFLLSSFTMFLNGLNHTRKYSLFDTQIKTLGNAFIFNPPEKVLTKSFTPKSHHKLFVTKNVFRWQVSNQKRA